jgi:hypothetical protein
MNNHEESHENQDEDDVFDFFANIIEIIITEDSEL